MQLLLSKSEEFGETEGLNIIKGNVKKFHSKKIHIGWSQVKVLRKQKLLKDEDFMYFVHSYYVDLVDKKNALTNTNFDNNEFCSSFIYENILACQFHPEKSGPSGLNLLKKFISQEYNYYD
jgi:glutamine amidotransferase